MVNAFWRWVNHLSGPGELATLEQLSRRAGDAQFVDFKNKMSIARYGDPPAAWLDKGQILPQAGTFRRKLKGAPKTPADGRSVPLNPRQTGSSDEVKPGRAFLTKVDIGFVKKKCYNKGIESGFDSIKTAL